MRWQDRFGEKVITAEEAAKLVKAGNRVGLGTGVAPASKTAMALAGRRDELKGVSVYSNHSKPWPWFESGWEESIRAVSFFSTPFSRQADRENRADWVPWAFGLSDGIRHRQVLNGQRLRGASCRDADVAIFAMPSPDENGLCSFGPEMWWNPINFRTAKVRIAEVDTTLPWVYGENFHYSELTCMVDPGPPQPGTAYPLPVPPEDEVGPLAVIGSYIADLINDGDTVQVGTGSASEAVLEFLGAKNDLGIDSEIMPTTMVELVRSGVFTSRYNNLHPGKHFTSTVVSYLGDPRRDSIMAYLDHNASFEFRDTSYICNVPRIASNDNLVAVNNAIAIDLTGQVQTSHLGKDVWSGIGGHPEFNIASHYSKNGRSITAMLSTARGGTVSRIVPQFESGAMIGIPNIYVDYLVTEHGVVNLDCKSLKERAEAIISVAHSDFQPELRAAARKLFWS